MHINNSSLAYFPKTSDRLHKLRDPYSICPQYQSISQVHFIYIGEPDITSFTVLPQGALQSPQRNPLTGRNGNKPQNSRGGIPLQDRQTGSKC